MNATAPADNARPPAAPVGGATTVAVLLIAGGLIGCSSVAPQASRRQAQAKAELLAVDREFAAAAARLGTDAAFAQFAAPDATLLPQNEMPVHGRNAIREAARLPNNVTLKWSPEVADAAASGDLGWTWGFYEVRAPGPDGRPVVRGGKYVTIWRRQPDDTWRYVVDIGNQNTPQTR